MTDTQHATYSNVIPGDMTPGTTVEAVLGYSTPDRDNAAVTTAFREAINNALPEGVQLIGDAFYGPADYDFDRNEIAEIIENISIGDIAAALTEIRWTNFEAAHEYVTGIIGDPADVIKENPTDPHFIYNTENITRKLLADLTYIEDGDVLDGRDLSEILEDVTPFAYVEASRIYLAEGCTVRIGVQPTMAKRSRYEATCSCGTTFGSWFPWMNHGQCIDCARPETPVTLSDLMDSTRAGL